MKFHRRLAFVTIFFVIFALMTQVMPFHYDRAYAGTGGEISTVAGSGDYGEGGDGALAVAAELSNPLAVAIDSSGNLYIADSDNNKIRKVDAISKKISTIAGTGVYGYFGDGGLATNAELRTPAGVAVDAAGNVYIADQYNNRIRKVGTDGNISTIVGTGDSDDLSSPTGIALDSLGNLYIADTGNSRILKAAPDSSSVTKIAGKTTYGTYVASDDGGPAIDAELNEPQAVAFDSAGNLYIADTKNNRIRKVDTTTGIIDTVAGSSSMDGYSGDGGPAVSAKLNEPEGVAVDASGNLYIADTDNNRIRKVTTNGRISTIAGTGSGGFSGDDVLGSTVTVDGPSGVALDIDGNLYIADYFNYRIRKLTPYLPSNSASLSNITLSNGTLSPAFSSLQTSYTASVVNGLSTLRVTPTASPFNTVEVNGEEVESGNQSGDINLDVGENTITVVARAEDGTTTQTYTLTVTRSASSNANLNNLTLSSGALSPVFGSNTTSYAVNASQSETTVTPTLADSLATVKVSGTSVTSGTASLPIPLDVGTTDITVEVTAQNGTTKTYTIHVTRALSTNADLSELSLSNGTLSPAFGAATTGYAVNVGNSVSSLIVTPTVADRTATVTVNDVPVASGTASATLPLAVGSNTIKVAVTAENGSHKSYTITVTRAESSNADLVDLTMSSGTLIPWFVPGTFKSSVGYGVSSVTVTPTVSDVVYAQVEVSLYTSGGALVTGPLPVASGAPSSSLPLGVGSNTITVMVTAQDGTTKTYTVTVTRGASSNADLSNLTLSDGTLVPAFAGTYTASVGYAVSSLTVTPTLSDAANASVTASVYDSGGARVSGPHVLTSGAASPSLPLNVGNNVISILVTAQDGSIRTYTITVTRAASNHADLSGLSLSSGTLSPVFEPATTNYTASVENNVGSVNMAMNVADADKDTTTVSVYNSGGELIGGPFAMTSGTADFALSLSVGSNAISVIVTAQDGSTKTYKVAITRKAPVTPPSGGGGGGGGGGAPSVSGPAIDVNGQQLDPASIDTTKPFVTLDVTPQDGVAYVSVPASILTALAKSNADFYLAIEAPYGLYQVPVNLAARIPKFDDLLAKHQLKAEDVSFKITLTDRSGDKQLQAAIARAVPTGKKLGATVDFHIEILHTNTGLSIGDVDQFNQTITRFIPIPQAVAGASDPWGAFRYNEAERKPEFVPAQKLNQNGAWYIAIRSYTNSVYIAMSQAVSFSDTETHWSRPLVTLAAAKGLVEGVGGGEFAPDRGVTRAEFATLLVRAVGRGSAAAGASASAAYVDVKPDDWYFDAVAQAKALGLLDWASGMSFQPDRPLSRMEMASMLAAAVDRYQPSVTAEGGDLDNYHDLEGVAGAYLDDIRLMVQLQIMTGTSDDTFDPQGEVTRAQATAGLIRTLQALGMTD
ncbi:cadherin-like beta sandwich domain-containing protein [Paenibacillus oryzisoli]|uniref:cadherin-like beta sandwich domain-containing protein n=1 Tax=Paenibacillus oryzisoli TaxID=1850517 RepID=UPI003D2D0997